LNSIILFTLFSLFAFFCYFFKFNYKSSTLIIALSLAIFSGFRTGGYDIDNYQIMIDNINNSHDLELQARLVLSKDILFLIIVDFAYYLFPNYNYWPSLLLISLLSSFFKYKTFLVFKENSVFVWLFYIIFMSATLEFSAYRACFSISLLGYFVVTFANNIKSKILIVPIILGHISTIPSFLNLFIRNTQFKKHLAFLAILLVIISMIFMKELILISQRGESYEDNLPTFIGLFFPVVVFFIYFLTTYTKSYFDLIDFNFLLFSSLSIGSLFISVGISHRLTEIAMFLLILIFFRQSSKKFRTPYIFIPFILFILTLSVRMILNGAWMSITIF